MKFVSNDLEFYLESYKSIGKFKLKTEGEKNKKAELDAQEAAQPS